MNKRPQNPTPRQVKAWNLRESRIRAIGVVLDSFMRKDPLDDGDLAQRDIHLSRVARWTGIPETSLRKIAADHFTAIRVPGHVVGYQANRFYLARADEP